LGTLLTNNPKSFSNWTLLASDDKIINFETVKDYYALKKANLRRLKGL